MADEQFSEGHWKPAQPLPEPFGVRWERFAKFRRNIGQSSLRSFVAAVFDARRGCLPRKLFEDAQTGGESG